MFYNGDIMKYKYNGTTTIQIYGVGIVKPDQEFKTDLEINHPLINKVEAKTSKKEVSKNKEK